MTDIAANVAIQLQSADGVAAGPRLVVPQGVGPAQLETLLNSILQDTDGQRYSFYVDEQPLVDELGKLLLAHKITVERVLAITYQPQAVFRVRPVARCSTSMPGHTDAVLAAVFSPDGRHLASGSGDSTVRFWDLMTQTPALTGKGHRNWVLCVAWSPDAALLASGGMDNDVRLWDAATGLTRGCCRGHKKWITSIAWEPAHLAYPSRRLASGSKDSDVRVWDAARGAVLLTLTLHTAAVTCVKWGGDGLIFSSSQDCTVMVWDAKDGSCRRTLKGHGHWSNTISLSTEYVLRTGPFDHNCERVTNAVEAQQKALARYEAARAGQNERLVSGSDDFTLFLWEPAVKAVPVARMTGHHQIVNQVQFSPDGRWIASASFDKAVKLWNGLTGAFVATFTGHVGAVYQLAWSADSRLIVSGSKDSTVKVWEVESRKLKVNLPGHADEVYAVDWSPNGESVVSGGKDTLLKLWRA